MKKTKLLLTSLIFLIFILFNTFIIVNAEDKEYEIDNADFYIQLSKDGDALVTETWTITYKKGDFTRFYKEIYNDLPKLEKFDKIDIQSFTINGKDCSQTFNITERLPFTYYASYSGNNFSIQWFYPVNNETVTYSCTYVLSNVVKETDNNVALFCYRVIGDNFDKKIKHTTVSIYLPKEYIIDVRYSSSNNYEIFDDHIIFENNNSKGMQKYHIATNSNVFNSLTFIPLSEIKENNSTSNKFELNEDSLTWIIIGIFVIVFIIVSIILGRIENKKQKIFEQKILQNPNYMTNIINSLINQNIHPLAIRKTDYISNKKFLLAIIFDLCRRNEAYITQEEIILSKNIINIQPFESNVLNLLFNYFNYRYGEDYYAFNINLLNETLLDETIAKDFNKNLTEIKNSYLKEYPINRINKDMITDFSRYFKMIKFNTNIDEYLYIIIKNHTIDYLYIVGLIYDITNNTRNNKEINHRELELDLDILDDLLETLSRIDSQSNNSSSSGCSSCSSCSSCSGCGGGGAD